MSVLNLIMRLCNFVDMASKLNNTDLQKKLGHLEDPGKVYEVFCEVLRALIEKYMPTVVYISQSVHEELRRTLHRLCLDLTSVQLSFAKRYCLV